MERVRATSVAARSETGNRDDGENKTTNQACALKEQERALVSHTFKQVLVQKSPIHDWQY